MDKHYLTLRLPQNKRPIEPRVGSVGHLVEKEGSRFRLRFNFPLVDDEGSEFEIAHSPEHAWIDLWYDEDSLRCLDVDRGDYKERLISVCDHRQWTYSESQSAYKDGYSGAISMEEPHSFCKDEIPDLYSGNHMRIVLHSAGRIEFWSRVRRIAFKRYSDIQQALREWHLLREMSPLSLHKDIAGLGYTLEEV